MVNERLVAETESARKPRTTIATLVIILIAASTCIFSKARIKAKAKSRKLSKASKTATTGNRGITSLILVKNGARKITEAMLKISKQILIKKAVEKYWVFDSGFFDASRVRILPTPISEKIVKRPANLRA